MAAFALLTMAAGRLAGVVGAVAEFGGFVAVLSLAMWSGMRGQVKA